MRVFIKPTILTFLLLLIATLSLFATGLLEDDVEKDYAFFEGAERSFILGPSDGFRLVIDEAISDGYSFAFIPENQNYDSSDIRIMVHLMRLKKDGPEISLDDFIHDDTLDLRSFYGQSVRIDAVDSLKNGSNELLPTVYFNDDSLFMTHVMNSYYSSKTEFLIFELMITENYPRFNAEAIFVETILNFRTLPRGELGSLE